MNIKGEIRSFGGGWWRGSFILFIWIILLVLGFMAFFRWPFNIDLIYQPREPACILCTKQLLRFTFTVSLFAVAGNIAKNVHNIYGKYWQKEALVDRFRAIDKDAENAEKGTDEKKEYDFFENHIKSFLNSSPANITFFRPVFFPIVSAILAIPAILLIYGFNADLPRIAVVSFFVGLVANVVLEKIQEKADNFVKGLLGTS